MRGTLNGILAMIIASGLSALLAPGAAGQERQDQMSSAGQKSSTAAKAAESHVGQLWDGWAAAEYNARLRMHGRFHSAPRERFDGDEGLLDERIQRVAQGIATVERQAEVPTGDDTGFFSIGDLTPFSFQIMGYASIAVAIFGLIIVVRHRPKFAGLRGKNDSRDARRTVVSSIIALVVLNLADLGFTSLLVPTRSFVELNPFADSLMSSLPMLILVKLALIGGGTLLLLLLWRHKVAQLASWGTAVTYVFAAMWWVMYFHTALS